MANQIPELFDPVKFARQGESISGQIELANLSRFMSWQMENLDEGNVTLQDDVVTKNVVIFELNFSLKGRAYIASGNYETEVTLLCQRCLEPMRVPLTGDIGLEFVIGETAESSLVEKKYDLVNLTTETIKLQDLIEDELLLALPFAPVHEEIDCPATQQISDLQTIQAQDKPNPFAVLAELKKNQES